MFPNCLKLASLTPIFKKGNSSDVSCYRPIYAPHFLSKIFEQCICEIIASVMTKFLLFSVKHFGFQRKKLTLDAMKSLTVSIYSSLTDKNYYLSIFVDLKQACDNVDHDIHSPKLNKYGCSGSSFDWRSSYLQDGKQCVRIRCSYTQYSNMNMGIPQDSILAALLILFL